MPRDSITMWWYVILIVIICLWKSNVKYDDTIDIKEKEPLTLRAWAKAAWGDVMCCWSLLKIYNCKIVRTKIKPLNHRKKNSLWSYKFSITLKKFCWCFRLARSHQLSFSSGTYYPRVGTNKVKIFFLISNKNMHLVSPIFI